jgi:GrpB-like predicted nucleotidyltransferase (UPF0157 family)
MYHVPTLGASVFWVLRNWLGSHPEDRREYEQIKRMAAAGQTIDSNEYARAKTKFIRRTLDRAE